MKQKLDYGHTLFLLTLNTLKDSSPTRSSFSFPFGVTLHFPGIVNVRTRQEVRIVLSCGMVSSVLFVQESDKPKESFAPTGMVSVLEETYLAAPSS